MRKLSILIVFFLLALAGKGSAQPSQCTVQGTIYQGASTTGSAAACSSCQIQISGTQVGGSAVGSSSVIVTANGSGVVSFTLPRGSITTLRGNFFIGTYNFSQGLRVYIPNQASAALETDIKTVEDTLAALVGVSTAAPSTATYITKTTNASLPNAFALGSLATGLLKNTTTTGTPTIAVSGTDYAPATSGSSILSGNGSGGFSNVTIGSGLSFSGGTLAASGGGGAGTWGSITGTLSSQTDLQAALDAKQALDSDLTAIAALSPSNDDIVQRKAGAWTNRTIAQLKTDLSLSGSNTGDQTISLTGDVTGSGTGSFAVTLANLPTGVPMAGSLLATNIAAPSTPATGKTSIYVDSTSKNFAAKNDAGTVNHGVQTRTASASNWIRAIADDGSTTISQPAFTDISGSVAASQMPALTGDVTTSAGAVATTIGSNKVTNAMLATVSTATFKGRTTAGTGNVEDLTATQATALLNAVVGDSGSGGTKGLVPAPASGDAAAGKFLKADGTFAVPTANVSFANPSASVGLTAVNGSASTAMRSDAAPALDQAIAPTWTGIHTFNNGVTTGTGASSGTVFSFNSLTTGTGANFASSSVTSGSVVNIASTSTAAASSTLKGLNIAISGANGTTAQTVTGASISVTNTNATSGTNKALVLAASGATTANRAIDVTAGQIVASTGTITTDQPAIDLAQTWNNAGAIFTGLKLNVTSTASASTSLLADFQIGGSSVVKLTRGGSVSITDTGFSEYSFRTTGNNAFRADSSGIAMTLNKLNFSNSYILAWSSTSNWFDTADLFLRRSAAANLAFGATDAAAPVAQTLSVQNVVAGTSNTAGADWTFKGSAGTGTGAGGKLIFQTAPAGSTGTSQNSFVTGFTLQSDGVAVHKSVTFANLPTVVNGGTIFCSDCTAASSPCTSGGTGAMAMGQNSAWKCF